MAAATDSAVVDVEATIASFLANTSCTSLELPNLTAEQRKHARKLADQHPELKCESYGFGPDRQLHLFKKELPSVRVKNTFIDDWISPEGSDGVAEPVVFRSMPQGLAKHLAAPCQPEQQTSEAIGLEPGTKVEHPSPGCSTTASAAVSSASPSTEEAAYPASPASSSRELHTLPEGVEVRNTFIHIEGSRADERIVQSMPHGMFRQSLLEEAAPERHVVATPVVASSDSLDQAPTVSSLEQPYTVRPPAGPPVVPAATGPPVVQPAIALGTEVVVEGLTKFPAFNGLIGFVQNLDEGIGRYDVLLLSPAAPGGRQWAKIKAENLRPVVPTPPPCYAPTVASR